MSFFTSTSYPSPTLLHMLLRRQGMVGEDIIIASRRGEKGHNFSN